jgi:protein-S-isoprenylcysteine O-methyltransferase Ste14
MAGSIVFLIGSAGFIFLSRKAFTHPYSHGFPRFFAFEALLGLVVLNAPNWFTRPFSLPQVISWALLILAAYLAGYAIWVLRTAGAPDQSLTDAHRLGMEKTTRLVTTGPYQTVRHPMYTSLLCLAWGIFLKQIGLLSTLFAIIISLTLLLTAVYEERENLVTFGEEYARYMKKTRRFIPFIF